MQEKDIEKQAGVSPELESHESDSLDNIGDTGLEPIHRPVSTATRNSRHSTALSRERSTNGFGVDEDSDEPTEETPDAAAAAPPAKDPFEVGWENGDDDPLNPKSMPLWRKWSIVIITSVGSFCVTNASSIYASTYTKMDAEFGTGREVTTLGLSAFVLGIALGPFWSPLAEFYGRRPIYLASFGFFLIWLVPSAVAQNIQTMIVARFLQGVAGSAFLSVSGGTVGDMFVRSQMQAPMAIFTLAPLAGPSLGPLIGGFINWNTSWRWTYYMLLIWAGVMLAVLFFCVPETYHPILLKKKAKKLRKETGDERWIAPIERHKRSIFKTIKISLIRPVQLIISEPMCLILDIYTAILLGIIYLFFGAFNLVFSNNHGFNLWQIGLTFLGLFVGMVIACLTSPIWQRVKARLVVWRGKKTGEPRPEPEDQLPPLIVGAPLIVIGLFWFGFTTYPSVHWIVPIIGAGVFGLGISLAFTGIFTFLVDAYPLYAASALAGNALIRCTTAAVFPLFGVQMYERLGYQWASALLAFLTLAMLPSPYLFFIYGKRLRGRSNFATKS